VQVKEIHEFLLKVRIHLSVQKAVTWVRSHSATFTARVRRIRGDGDYSGSKDLGLGSVVRHAGRAVSEGSTLRIGRRS
jgi:hypothetical protein